MYVGETGNNVLLRPVCQIHLLPWDRYGLWVSLQATVRCGGGSGRARVRGSRGGTSKGGQASDGGNGASGHRPNESVWAQPLLPVAMPSGAS